MCFVQLMREANRYTILTRLSLIILYVHNKNCVYIIRGIIKNFIIIQDLATKKNLDFPLNFVNIISITIIKKYKCVKHNVTISMLVTLRVK